jgi:glucosylceramidase
VDTEAGKVHYQPAFFYIGQVTKFIKPGAVCIESTSGTNELQNVAFRNQDGSIAVVVMNQTDQPKEVQIEIGANAASSFCPPHAIQTYVTR